jgi:hypothetical protein
MDIRSELNWHLLEQYSTWVKYYHYDPVDNIELPQFSMKELEDEILRRMEGLEDLNEIQDRIRL